MAKNEKKQKEPAKVAPTAAPKRSQSEYRPKFKDNKFFLMQQVHEKRTNGFKSDAGFVSYKLPQIEANIKRLMVQMLRRSSATPQDASLGRRLHDLYCQRNALMSLVSEAAPVTASAPVVVMA